MGSSSALAAFHCPLLRPPPPATAPSFRASLLRSVVLRAEPQGAGPPDPPPPDKAAGKPLGFGTATVRRKGKGAKVVRRAPIQQKPQVVVGGGERNPKQQQQQSIVNEDVFLLAWLGLGLLIFVEGLVLAASGLLPEQWDSLFVKYLYPSFTPTVILFVGGTVVYGASKYLQNENEQKKSK